MKLRLVDDWRRWWRLWSIRLNIIGTTLMTVYMAWPGIVLELWNQMPAELKERMPPRLMLLLALAFFLAGTIARIVRQKPHGE